MNRRSRTEAVVATLVLMMITGIASWLNGYSNGLIFQKVLIAPMFLLAGEGLRAHFPENLDGRRSMAGQAQFELLNAALLGAFITGVGLKTDDNFWRALLLFVVFVVIYGSLKISMFWYSRNRRQRTD
ncbi:hypothetical protein RMR21_014450 [Agrobacterium sp. rho-8.1]|nr:hypothetical protein [Agrobacterium sp. rho-8.1]